LEEEVVTHSERETEAAGERLGRKLARDDVVYLVGELGSGKTCFARGLARGTGALAREVASPTFAILNEYASASGAIVLRHVDLYRLKDSLEELEALGLPGAAAGAPVAVEWPRAAIRKLLPPTVEVSFDALPGERRRIKTR
jgi:tRNA threonylcarbamoyladenosine biosynthesis protein TsaE